MNLPGSMDAPHRMMNTRNLLAAAVLALAGCADNGAGPAISGALIENARQSGTPTLVEFGAASCKSCRDMKATLDSVAQQRQGKAHVIVVDLSKEWDLGRAYRIQLMPTQVFFDTRGNEAQRHMGAMEREEILAVLDKLSEVQP